MTDDEMTDDETLMLDIARAAVARFFSGEWHTAASKVYLDTLAKLTPEQITACVEWAKKQVKHG